MQHKVDGNFLRGQIHPADGVGAGHGPLLSRQRLAQRCYIHGLGVLKAGVQEQDLHVHIRGGNGLKIGHPGAAGHDAHHVRAQSFLAQHLQGVLNAGLSASSSRACGSGISCCHDELLDAGRWPAW